VFRRPIIFSLSGSAHIAEWMRRTEPQRAANLNHEVKT